MEGSTVSVQPVSDLVKVEDDLSVLEAELYGGDAVGVRDTPAESNSTGAEAQEPSIIPMSKNQQKKLAKIERLGRLGTSIWSAADLVAQNTSQEG
jgi:hypothetical protein